MRCVRFSVFLCGFMRFILRSLKCRLGLLLRPALSLPAKLVSEHVVRKGGVCLESREQPMSVGRPPTRLTRRHLFTTDAARWLVERWGGTQAVCCVPGQRRVGEQSILVESGPRFLRVLQNYYFFHIFEFVIYKYNTIYAVQNNTRKRLIQIVMTISNFTLSTLCCYN